MQQRYSAFLLTSLFVLLLGTCARAQVNLVQDFEGTNDLTYTTNPAPYTVGEDVWNIVAGVGSIMPSGTGGTMFWGGRDIENDNGGQAGRNVLTFDVTQICAVTSPEFSFEYNVFGFDGGDDFGYTLILDGTAQADVLLIDGGIGGISTTGWENAAVTVPEGTINATLIIFADQNGGADYFGLDNVVFSGGGSQGGCGSICGITAFGDGLTETCTGFDNNADDGVIVSFDYTGFDAGALLGVMVDGATVAFTNSGADPTSDDGGTIVITSPALTEDTDYEITLTGGNCSYSVAGSIAAGSCVSVCDLSVAFPADVTATCVDFTSADNADAIMVEIDYSGFEPGIVVLAPGLTVSGDDPASDPDGTVVVTGLVEGGNYVISISGGDCTGGDAITIPVAVPSNFCTPSAIVINEVLADPGSVNDANNDGTFDGSDDEFIEIFNTGTDDIDVSGWTISEGAGVRYTFPSGYILPGRNAFVLFGGGTPNVPCLNDVADTPFIGLNNGGDVVILKTALGLTVAQMSYGAEGNNDQSVALNPDGDVASGYVLHTTIDNPTGAPLTQSACLENDNPQFSLPIELLNFSATPFEKSVHLNWATDNEISNDRFVIERSFAGSQWIQLAMVEASGQTADEYTFVDEAPVDGQNIYRLRQIDLDGSYAIYGPAVADFSAATLGVHPNPAGDVLRFNRDLSAADEVILHDGSGRVLSQLNLNNGTANVSNLQPGIYVLRVREGNRMETVRFVKK